LNATPKPPLRFLHAETTLNQVKLDLFRRLSTKEIKSSLAPGQPGSLKTRPDGTVLDGHHRLTVLIERGEDVNKIDREIIEKENDEA
jgi:hypothetical protein